MRLLDSVHLPFGVGLHFGSGSRFGDLGQPEFVFKLFCVELGGLRQCFHNGCFVRIECDEELAVQDLTELEQTDEVFIQVC